jgi:hypothetical protein
MVRHILGMLDDFLHAFPLLSFVRGEAFTPDHWASLFRTLEFDTSKVRSGKRLLISCFLPCRHTTGGGGTI